jgi:hypothetical protein
VSTVEALRPIPTGNAVAVEARAADCLSAARLALAQLAEVAHPANLTSMSVQVSVIGDDHYQPWEAVAFGALLD